ncbi:hypothetical protein ACFFRR_011717 [Megaselia abdita]
MKFLITFLIASTIISFTTAQLYFHSSPHTFAASEPLVHYRPLAHQAVVDNAIRESHYPPEYINHFYKNPHIAAALAKESELTSKEMLVYDRKAEEIPREQVFKIFKNAGWIKRR